MSRANFLSVLVKQVIGEGHHVIAVHILSVGGIGTRQLGLVRNHITCGEVLGISAPHLYATGHHERISARVLQLQVMQVGNRGTAGRIAAPVHTCQFYYHLRVGVVKLIASGSIQHLLELLHTGGVGNVCSRCCATSWSCYIVSSCRCYAVIGCTCTGTDAVSSVELIGSNVYRTVLDAGVVGGIVVREHNVSQLSCIVQACIDGLRAFY